VPSALLAIRHPSAADVLVVMLVENRSFRWLELGIFTLVLGIFGW
jgi:hypothetical protein